MTQPGDQGEPAAADSPQENLPTTPQWPSTGGGEPAAYPQEGAGPPPPPTGAVPPPVYAPTPQTSNSAIIALVLSIVAWVVCPIIPAIIALVFASKADKEIAASNGWVTGGGLVTAAKIVSWINIGLYAAIIAVGLLVVIIAAVGGALS